jgi:hypothetical protein
VFLSQDERTGMPIQVLEKTKCKCLKSTMVRYPALPMNIPARGAQIHFPFIASN